MGLIKGTNEVKTGCGCKEAFWEAVPFMDKYRNNIRNIAIITGIVCLVLGIVFAGQVLAVNPKAWTILSFSAAQKVYYYSWLALSLMSFVVAFLAHKSKKNDEQNINEQPTVLQSPEPSVTQPIKIEVNYLLMVDGESFS